jgi:hypothetical protein
MNSIWLEQSPSLIRYRVHTRLREGSWIFSVITISVLFGVFDFQRTAAKERFIFRRFDYNFKVRFRLHFL